MAHPAGAGLDQVRGLAMDLASSLGGDARASTTPGIERATLRLLAVNGLDRDRRPLAAAVVDRAIGDDAARLARGVLLPLAAAVGLYEASPLEVALDVASGTIDLDLEADALGDPARRQGVRDGASALVRAALARIDANRTARAELIHVLGEPQEPLLVVPVRAGLVDRARPEAVALVAGGADQVIVDIPASRELVDRLAAPGGPADGALETARAPRADGEVPPAGSQRALAEIRIAVDATAAERREYGRIAVIPRALGAPEAAVVAGFERLDAVWADPLTEIVSGGVDPARALADHSFARRLLRRAGCRIVIDPGPLVVAPDLEAGAPSPAVVRAGRAIALQALSVELARADGLPDAAIRIGVLPEWVLGERAAGAIAVATIAVQRRIFPGLGLTFIEPSGPGEIRDRWWQVRPIGTVVAGGAAATVREVDGSTIAAAAAENRTAARIAAELVADAGAPRFGDAFDALVDGIAASAVRTLEALAADGWDAVLGRVPAGGSRMAGGTTVRRGEAPDVPALETSPAT